MAEVLKDSLFCTFFCSIEEAIILKRRVMLEYILCYATSFTLGTMFGMYLSYVIIKWIKEKKLW